jgi:hypothetical protein
MAILDAKLIMSDDQAETTVAAHDSDTQLDLGAGTDELGNAEANELGLSGKLWLHIKVRDALTSGGSATVAIDFQDSADDSTYASTGISLAATAYDDAIFTAGNAVISQPLPAELRRYVKVVYTIGTAVLTAGSFDAWIGHGPLSKADM